MKQDPAHAGPSDPAARRAQINALRKRPQEAQDARSATQIAPNPLSGV